MNCMNRNFSDCELKEYVDQPKLIRLKPDKRRRPVTRSQPEEEEMVVHSRVVPGSFYALDESDKLAIVRCISVNEEISFQGVFLHPVSELEGVYQEKNQVFSIFSSLVHSEIFSVEKLSDGKISVSNVEIEEILLSLNT